MTKKLLSIFFSLSLFLLLFPTAGAQFIPTQGDTSQATILAAKQQPISVVVNGERVQFDVAPVMINNRVMVPMRAVLEKMGVTVLWDEENITSVGLTKQHSLLIYDEGMQLNGVPAEWGYSLDIDGEGQELDVYPQNINNRILVPLRAVTQAFGAQVNWDDTTKTVTIVSSIPSSDRLSQAEISSIESFTYDKAYDIYSQKGYIGIETDDGCGYGYENGKKYEAFGAWALGTTKEYIEYANSSDDWADLLNWVQVVIYNDGTIAEFPLE